MNNEKKLEEVAVEVNGCFLSNMCIFESLMAKVMEILPTAEKKSLGESVMKAISAMRGNQTELALKLGVFMSELETEADKRCDAVRQLYAADRLDAPELRFRVWSSESRRGAWFSDRHDAEVLAECLHVQVEERK